LIKALIVRLKGASKEPRVHRLTAFSNALKRSGYSATAHEMILITSDRGYIGSHAVLAFPKGSTVFAYCLAPRRKEYFSFHTQHLQVISL